MKPYYENAEHGIKLFHSDCLDVLPTLAAGSVDAVVTDPPYGMNALDGTRVRRFGINRSDNWDCIPVSKRHIQAVLDSAPACVIWGMNYLCGFLPSHKGFLVWNKPHIAHLPNRSAAEVAFTNLDMPASCISLFADRDTEHPTQKPVALMAWCLSLLPNAETILDPFAGSGTTAIACIRTGRQFIGVEIEERYCEIAAKRIERELAQPYLPGIERAEPIPQRTLFEAVPA